MLAKQKINFDPDVKIVTKQEDIGNLTQKLFPCKLLLSNHRNRKCKWQKLQRGNYPWIKESSIWLVYDTIMAERKFRINTWKYSTKFRPLAEGTFYNVCMPWSNFWWLASEGFALDTCRLYVNYTISKHDNYFTLLLIKRVNRIVNYVIWVVYFLYQITTCIFEVTGI